MKMDGAFSFTPLDSTRESVPGPSWGLCPGPL